MSAKFTVMEHPLIQHKLGYLRDKTTGPSDFRRITKELTKFLAYEATKDLKLSTKKIKTPMSDATISRVDNAPIIVSIMRAGNGMIDSMLESLPFCSAGHIGIYRDKFIKNTVEYYFKLPENVKGKDILLIDPLLATGDTVVASIDRLKQYEVGNIKLLTILTCKEGIERVQHFHPDVEIFTLGADETLNEKGYLIPGLGDAGDRLFGTDY
jgi:uracil phosphoribosyltransferase